MAGKRGATSDLNHDNWDQDDKVEDSGTFKKAADDVLKRRIIKTARRRNPTSNLEADTDEKKASVFGGFSCFGRTPPNPKAAFDFLNTNKSEVTPNIFGGAKVDKPDLITNKEIKINKPDTNGITKKIEKTIEKESNNNSDDYLAKLKGLNESVSSWIKKHVDSNPFINLKPIFNDYERYLDELEMKKDIIVNDNTKSELNKFSFKSPEKTNEPKATLSFNTPQTKNDSIKTATASTFTFGNPNKPIDAPKISFEAPKTSPTYTFGAPTSGAPISTSGFAFGGANSTPFTFSNVAKPADSAADVIEINDDDEPPKVEFTPVVEDGHIFTTRCKVFVKKDGTFGDRGVGNLYLKPIPDSEKVQLIVRADTNLGNLLCNFVLSESIPTQRMGKKDVMLVCLPTPDVKPPPVPMLLRVKGSQEADELLNILEKHKK